jgi:hypothetical protein
MEALMVAVMPELIAVVQQRKAAVAAELLM